MVDSIKLSDAALRDYDYLVERNVRLIDVRDEVGKERLHNAESILNVGKLCKPRSVSGRCTRRAEGGASILESLLSGAREYLELWDRAASSGKSNGRGGSVYFRPVAVILSNYGGSLYCMEAHRRVEYF